MRGFWLRVQIGKIYGTKVRRLKHNQSCFELRMRIAFSLFFHNLLSDMGGRDKALSASATLVDSEGNKVKNRKIPLQLTLLYDNEDRTQVAKQDIFRIIGTSSYHIDPETGEAPLQFRIEDVSKNHQKQNFIIEVSVDKEKCPDIAPAYSRAICVRSKKKKDSGSRKRPISNDSLSSQKKHAPAIHFQANPPRPEPQPQSQTQQQPLPLPQFTAPSSEPYMLGSTQNAQQIREAMSGIITWTEEVVNGLGPLKWNVIGYAQNPDSGIDHKRPYYSMPNPNDKVNQILSMYAENTREHLRVILEAVEILTGPSTNNDGTYGSARLSTNPQSRRSTSLHPSSYSISNQISGRSFHPPQWQSKFHEHTTNGSVSHEASIMTSKARQTMPPVQTGRPMPPLHPPPPMQNTNWGQHHGQDVHHADHGEMSYQRTSDDEPDMSDTAIDLENRQTDVQYVFAKVFKSLQTNLHLGFPAYNIAKELLGFYKEGSLSSERGQFVPIHMHRDEFGPVEMEQASKILKTAILKHSKAVYALKDWDSLSNMIDHALNSEMPKDFEGDNPNIYNTTADVGRSGRYFS